MDIENQIFVFFEVRSSQFKTELTLAQSSNIVSRITKVKFLAAIFELSVNVLCSMYLNVFLSQCVNLHPK